MSDHKDIIEATLGAASELADSWPDPPAPQNEDPRDEALLRLLDDRGLSSAERATYYRYLFVPGTTSEPLFALTSLGITHPNPGSAGWGDLERVMATVESMTPETGWALGEQFTAADVVFGGLLDFSIRFGWMQASQKVAAYVDRIRARPAYQATHAGFAASATDPG